MQVSTKLRLKKKSLHTLKAPEYTFRELRFCYHYIGYLKRKDLEIGLHLSFCWFFTLFFFYTIRPNQIGYASLLHTYLISRQQGERFSDTLSNAKNTE